MNRAANEPRLLPLAKGAPIDPLAEELALADDEPWAREARLVLAAGVRLGMGRIVDGDGGDESYRRGDRVVVDLGEGELFVSEVVVASRRVLREAPPLRILRRVGANDAQAEGELRSRERALESRAREEARALGLPLRVVRVESVPGAGKVVLSFSSEEKIVFRDWLRALVATEELAAMGARLELRQIGFRDAARRVGGVGPCGLTLCCNTFLGDFPQTTVKMAQGQNLGTSPARISGACGKLLCCLAYEEAFYRAQRARLPALGETVGTPRGPGIVESVDILSGRVEVSCEGGTATFPLDALERSGSPASIPPGR